MKDFKHRTTVSPRRSRSPLISGLFSLLLLVIVVPLIYIFISRNPQLALHAAPPGFPNQTPTLTNPTPNSTNPIVKGVEVSILDNMMQNGFDPNTPGGGLWVNWRYGTNPLQTNFDGSGTAGGLGTDNDPLTDLRYLHNLWLYTSQNPGDTRYAGEIARYTPIVKAEFAGTTDQRGWLFDEEFLDLYTLSRDPFYLDTAKGLAAGYAQAIDPAVGIIFKKNSAHPQGYYRPEDDLEAACDLIQAGTLFHNPTWSQQGQTILNFLYTHAYLPTYHAFADQMDQVLLPDGAVNPSEPFFVDRYRNYEIIGNSMTMGSISQIIISLLDTYKVTHNQDFLTKAEDLLDPLSLPQNSLGIWDTTHLGYFASVIFTGKTPQQPGAITVGNGKKEAGRQELMLWAFHLADKFTNDKYQNMQDLMLTVALTRAYYAPGHGLMYETNPEWAPLMFPNHTLANAVTTESMGIELESLFSLKR